MLKIIKIYVCFFLIVLPSFTYAKEIVLVADEWCPYNCNPDSTLPGFMVEAAKLAFEYNGDTVTYVTIPWARAIIGVRDGSYDGIIGAGRAETPDFVFTKKPLGITTPTFYVKKDNQWRYEGLKSLNSILLGVIRDYSYGDLYNDYIRHHEKDVEHIQVMHGDKAIQRLLYMIKDDRIDAFIEGEMVYQYYLKSTNTPDLYKKAGTVNREEVFIAFSPAKSDSKKLALILEQGLEVLRRNGKFAKILEKYGVSDWVD